MNKEYCVRKIPIFHHNKKSNEWKIVEDSQNLSKLEMEHKKQIKVLNLNSLFDEVKEKMYKPNIVYSEERYRKQLAIFKEENPDVICLNEVTNNFLQILKKDEWIQRHFFISYNELKPKKNVKTFWNLLLSRIPITNLYDVQVFPNNKELILNRRPLVAEFKELKFIICSAHLSAYTYNTEKRKKQLGCLYKVMDNTFNKDNRFLILGDLNFHSENENGIIRKDYYDVYRELHPKTYKEGYTFDSTKNLMHFEMWPAGWVKGFDSLGLKMRLDRILFKGNKNCLESSKIIANEPVYQSKNPKRSCTYKLATLVTHIFDYFEYNIWRKKENYLFPSDHFGLVSKFNL